MNTNPEYSGYTVVSHSDKGWPEILVRGGLSVLSVAGLSVSLYLADQGNPREAILAPFVDSPPAPNYEHPWPNDAYEAIAYEGTITASGLTHNPPYDQPPG